MSPSQYRSNPPHGGWQRPYATAHAATVACAAAIAPLATSAHESAVPAVCGVGVAGARAASAAATSGLRGPPWPGCRPPPVWGRYLVWYHR